MQLSKLTAAILAVSIPFSVSASESLDQVVVSATNSEQSLKSVTSNTALITREEIEEKQYKTVIDALRTVPGISFKNNGGTGKATSIFMRGDSSGHVLVLVDGIDMTDAAGLGGAHIEQLSISDIERIEIIKGAQSGVWGANATAGVINIITRKTGKIAEANLEAGSRGTHKIATTLGDKTEQADLLVHFATQDTDGFSATREADKSHEKFEDDGYQQTDLSMKFGANLGKAHRIQAYFKQSTADNEFDGSSWVSPYPPLPDDETATNSQTQTIQNLQYLYSEGDINAKVFLSHNEINREFPTYFSEYNGTVRELGAQLGLNYGEDDQVNISASRKALKSESEEYHNNGIALTNTNVFGKTFVLTQSLRFDDYDKFDDVTTGKIGFKNFFSDDIYLSANYGTAYNAPLLSQLAQPNPVDLKPEKSKSADITLGLYSLEATYFSNSTKDLIEYVYQPWPTPYYYENADKEVETDGVELSYKRSFDTIQTDFNFNYTWLSARNSDGDQLKYRPERTATLGLDYYGLAKTHLGLETRYVGKVYSLDDKQGVQFGEYFVTDLVADYQVNSSLNLYAKIINVTDSDYTESVASATDDEADYVYSNGGRQFFIGIRSKL